MFSLDLSPESKKEPRPPSLVLGIYEYMFSMLRCNRECNMHSRTRIPVLLVLALKLMGYGIWDAFF